MSSPISRRERHCLIERRQFFFGVILGLVLCFFVLQTVRLYPRTTMIRSVTQDTDEKAFLKEVEDRFALKFMSRLNTQYKGVVDLVKPWDIYSEVYLWDWFPPLAPCRYRERIGILGDGGKWVCDLSRYTNPRSIPCVVYSFGVRGDSSFEAEMHERSSCQIFGFDFSVDGMAGASASMERIHFKKVGLGAQETHNLLTLKQIMVQNKHSFIDILKVDIEGAEFDVIPTLAIEFNQGSFPVEQLLLEIHHEEGRTAKFFKVMRDLRGLGMVPFSHETNYNPPARGLPAEVIEISFFNVNTWWR